MSGFDYAIAIIGCAAFVACALSVAYLIVDRKRLAAEVEDVLPKQPAPIRDAEFYMHNGHWIFGVRGRDESPWYEYYDHAEYGVCKGECDYHGV